MGPLAIFFGTWSTPERKHLFATPMEKLKINVPQRLPWLDRQTPRLLTELIYRLGLELTRDDMY
jgi:hypothetical protein